MLTLTWRKAPLPEVKWLCLFCQTSFSDCRLVTPGACLSSESVTIDNVSSQIADSFPPDVMPCSGQGKDHTGHGWCLYDFLVQNIHFPKQFPPSSAGAMISYSSLSYPANIMFDTWCCMFDTSCLIHDVDIMYQTTWYDVHRIDENNMFHWTWTFQDGAYTKPSPVLNSVHGTERHFTGTRGKR